MNLLIFCAILSLSSSLAFKVTFHTVDRENNEYGGVPVLVCTRHEFIYHIGDEFKLFIRLTKNVFNITKALVSVVNSGVKYYGQKFWAKAREQHLNMLNFHPKSDKFTIEVELSLNNTCVRQRILEGTAVSRTLQEGINITAFKYNDICLKNNSCVVLVDPTGECEDGNLTPLPCEFRRNGQVLAPADDQRSKTANETESNPGTPGAIGDSKEGAENTYFTIMIVTSITSAVALILLIVIAIRKRCWMKYNPPGATQILSKNVDPFYENVHLRTECEKEIEELEQRDNDVVPAEYDYVEINNRNITN